MSYKNYSLIKCICQGPRKKRCWCFPCTDKLQNTINNPLSVVYSDSHVLYPIYHHFSGFFILLFLIDCVDVDVGCVQHHWFGSCIFTHVCLLWYFVFLCKALWVHLPLPFSRYLMQAYNNINTEITVTNGFINVGHILFSVFQYFLVAVTTDLVSYPLTY